MSDKPKTKVPTTFEELMLECSECARETRQTSRNVKTAVHEIGHMINKRIDMLEQVIYTVKVQIDTYAVLMRDIKTLLHSADDTFRNAVSAIQQRAYLHAWYPAQCGNSEQMVVGSYANNYLVQESRELSLQLLAAEEEYAQKVKEIYNGRKNKESRQRPEESCQGQLKAA